MMTRLMNFLAMAAFAFVTLGASGAAHASGVRVKVDNLLDPAYENAKSSATLEVCVFVDQGVGELCSSKVLSVVASNWNYLFGLPSGFSVGNVEYVTLHMMAPGDTTDLLIVDEVSLWADGASIWHRQWGVDNSVGYCFSSQYADFSNTHCTTPYVDSPAHMLLLDN